MFLPKPPSGTYSGGVHVPQPPVLGLEERSVSVGSLQAGRTTVSGESGLGQVRLEPAPIQRITTESSDGSLSSFGSVVKVLVTFRDPDYSNPWQSKGVQSSVGSGVAIQTKSGLYILSAAHVVANQTFLQVQRTGVEDPDKYVASVHAVSHDCDLALLSVESEHFWKDLKPIALGSNPPLRSLVLVAGFPVGGQELSVTEGVVSRIESQRYSHSCRELLAATVDAAVNPGNSGGPAFNEQGDLIGIAFQTMTGADISGGFQISIQTVGHIILPSVIEKFLEGVETFGPKGYLGFPSAGIQYQPLTNPHLRKLFKLQDSVNGVLVTDVRYDSTCFGILKKDDILTHVNDKQVANNGTIALEGRYGRINLKVEFTMHQCGDRIPLRIIRGGKAQTVEVTARPFHALAPKEYDKKPRYFIWCGIVFQPLTIDYLQVEGKDSPYLCYLATKCSPSETERDIVVLTRTLSDSMNVGYENQVHQRIRSVNGESIKDLQDFVDKVEKSVEQALVDFETWEGDVIILPARNAASANDRILKHYIVADDRCLE